MEHKNPVIFLDIDGVLNQGGIESMGRIDADRLRAFCEFAKRTNAEIVISSYWRTKQILRTRIVAALARHGLQVSGWTPPPRDISSKRRSEIKSYIAKHCVKTYVILDDIADTGDMRKRWVVTKNGITRADLDKARKIIEEQTTEK
jgi:hypothetical protein